MEFVRQGFELQPLGEQTDVLSRNTYVLFCIQQINPFKRIIYKRIYNIGGLK